MAWETRNGGTYYVRKRRIGQRVVSEYVGSGQAGALAAAQDAQAQAERQERLAEVRAERQRQRELDAGVDRACETIGAVVAGTLDAAGFHRHKGQWRMKRG